MTIVVLELPVPPMMPIVSPASMCRVTSVIEYSTERSSYAKSTCMKSTDPFGTSMTGSAGSVIVGRSSSTSVIRSADATDMVIMTKIMESIIRLIRIFIQ